MRIWCTFLIDENQSFQLPLYTFEECVQNSLQPLCVHCQYSGWKHNFVSKRKYHFIIPVDNEWKKPMEDRILDLGTHILHGVIHCNGFGHLLRINGIEGGSNFIRGRQVMDLWDRICTALHTRKISVVDFSMKRNMELRVLYGLSYTQTWFSRWDYKFCRGSFGVTKHKYEQALENLSTLELDIITHDMQSCSIKEMISGYRNLSNTQLVTMGDLFRFMLSSLEFRTPQKKDLKAKLMSSISQKSTVKEEKQARFRKLSNWAAELKTKRWTVKRLEAVANVVVDALKGKKSENGNGMTRQEVRNAAKEGGIGDTGLIDYVLKRMDNVSVGGYVVRRAVNSCTGVLQYSLEETNTNQESDRHESVIPSHKSVSGRDVYNDITLLYKHLFGSVSDNVKLAVKAVIDSKIFTKEWPFHGDADDHYLRFICRVIPSALSINSKGLYKGNHSVGEELVMPLHATIHDLKAAAETAMRDTYFVMEDLNVWEIVELEGVIHDDDELVRGRLDFWSEISVRGVGVDLLNTNNLIYEGGADNWEVNCKCGATDDDGEKMVECDKCSVWHHTWCNGIKDSDDVPVFVCDKCWNILYPQGKHVVGSQSWTNDNGEKGDAANKDLSQEPMSDHLPRVNVDAPQSINLSELYKIGDGEALSFPFNFGYTMKDLSQEPVSDHLPPVNVDAQQSKNLSELYNDRDEEALSFPYSFGYTQYHMDINFWKKIYCDNDTSKSGRGWLDDEHIDIWGHILLETKQSVNCTIMPVHFMSTDSSSEWMENWIAIANGSYPPYLAWAVVDMVLLPINHENGHWLIGCLELKTWTLTIYDSAVLEYREAWMKAKVQAFDINAFLESIAYWQSSGRPFTQVELNVRFAKNIPQQTNEMDCGVFVCMWLEAFSVGNELKLEHSEIRDHCQMYRRQIADVIWENRSCGSVSPAF